MAEVCLEKSHLRVKAIAMNEDFPAATMKPPRRIGRVLVAGSLLAVGLIGFAGWSQWQESLVPRLREQLKEAAVRGRWQEVGSLSARLTELAPRDGEARMMRARAAHAQGNPVESARFLSEMPDCPQKQRALQELAELQLGPLVAPLAAEQTYRQMLERDPRSELAHQRLIFLYAITLQRQELMHEARQAMELHCEPVEAFVYLFLADELPFSNGPELNHRWLSGDPNAELFKVAEAIQLATSLKGGVLRDELEVVLRMRKLADDKDRALAGLFQRYPDNLELLAWHIERAIEHGDLDRTVELLSRLPARADADNRFWRFAGWAKAQLGRQQEALANYNQALQLHPLDWTTRHLLAGLRREQQHFDEVDRLEKIVQTGYELTLAIYVLPDARTVPDTLLSRLADFATECGDELFASSLRRQLRPRSDSSGQDG